MRHMSNACFAILNIATSFWLSENCGVIYKKNAAFITSHVQTVKFRLLISRK